MKKLFLIVATCVALFALVLVFNTSGANACFGRWSCGDSLIITGPSAVCVNGELLTVDPSADSALYVQVPDDATVSDPATCGTGTVTTMSMMALPLSSVNVGADKHMLKLAVQGLPDSTVQFQYAGQTETVTVKNNGSAWVKFDVK